MDELDTKLLFVFKGDVFLGVLSAGDIQRAILNNITLDSEVFKILRKNIRVANIKEKTLDIKSTMKEFRMECMPIVDDEGKLVDVLFWEDVLVIY